MTPCHGMHCSTVGTAEPCQSLSALYLAITVVADMQGAGWFVCLVSWRNAYMGQITGALHTWARSHMPQAVLLEEPRGSTASLPLESLFM
jgi:hypothetical protein